MKIISVITARGGSKGVPRKNIVDIKGKPLIWYAINASQKSNVNETWVSKPLSQTKELISDEELFGDVMNKLN